MTLTVYIGWDAAEPAAAAVLAHSIVTRASRPVRIVYLRREALAALHPRPRGADESTDFALTRFLVPALSDYTGWSLFLDCDMLVQADIYDLMLYPLANPGKAVYVCQHDYVPKSTTKFLGQAQQAYPRKNWSSVMLFDAARCRALTPELVNTATPAYLHRFSWLDEHANMRDDGRACMCDSLNQIGSLPLTWNWLVGEYAPNSSAQILHYTLGGPWFPETRTCDQAGAWREAYADMIKGMEN